MGKNTFEQQGAFYAVTPVAGQERERRTSFNVEVDGEALTLTVGEYYEIKVKNGGSKFTYTIYLTDFAEQSGSVSGIYAHLYHVGRRDDKTDPSHWYNFPQYWQFGNQMVSIKKVTPPEPYNADAARGYGGV